MAEKLEDMTAGGVDTATPRGLVVSIQKRGWLQSQRVQRVITALTSDWNDYDLGCFLCDFGLWYAIVRKHPHKDLAMHALLHHILTSKRRMHQDSCVRMVSTQRPPCFVPTPPNSIRCLCISTRIPYFNSGRTQDKREGSSCQVLHHSFTRQRRVVA